MIDAAVLVPALKAHVLRLEDDLRVRLDGLPEVAEQWRAEHRRLVEAGRTALVWGDWRDDRVTQAAVAWVLTTVFIRFAEDNALVRQVWIAGPKPRRQESLDAQLAYFRQHPDDTDREWLEEAISYLDRLPATRDLVGEHSPLWTVSPSGNAATALLNFWRQRNDQGELIFDFADDQRSTRFLGDLYQDLSEHAKKTFALLQTPEFVEEFILDQAMEPALAERALDGFRMIDPTCGSGHFLLGGFSRLLERWDRQAPAMELQERVQLALDAIHGVDVNPFAVAIARFRLTVAALGACGLTKLEDAPDFDYHLAVGDSLLFGRLQESLDFEGADEDAALAKMAYGTEDLGDLKTILVRGRYDVVVGNPPYITVKDKALNERYRKLYPTCKGTYALTVPFMERFFQLAKGAQGDQPAGWIGCITSNSFMKREFGSKLIEEFLPRQDLRLIVDTSGAYIPGHGTPTVIMVGQHRRPTTASVHAVLAKRGEPGLPKSPESGTVWTAIVSNVRAEKYENEWVSVSQLSRDQLQSHPWTFGGGEASVLMAWLAGRSRLRALISPGIGRAVRIGSDEAFIRTRRSQVRWTTSRLMPLLLGEDIRDYMAKASVLVLYPYDGKVAIAGDLPKELWSFRTLLRARGTFQGNMADAGRYWWEYQQHTASAYETRLSLAFANVATHNHFALNRGDAIFNAHAPVIKLEKGASEDDHLRLLAVLNSSIACFWLKQNSYPKGGDPIGADGARVSQQPWSDRYEFTGTTLEDFPLPERLPLGSVQRLDDLAQWLTANMPESVLADETPTTDLLAKARETLRTTRGEMISAQEELDWEIYGLYGLPGGDLIYDGGDRPGLSLGERAFEIALARKVVAGEEDTAWVDRHGSTPIVEIPVHWPEPYRDLVQRRLDLIASDPSIRLLEKPEHKRRWASEPWEVQQERALHTWLLDRLEDRAYWFTVGRPTPRSISSLADQVSRDQDLVSVLQLWEGRPDIPVVKSLTRLLADEAVPYLAAYRLKDSALRKRESWEETWALQRREDAGEGVGTIPVPQKYTSADFRKASYWQARGKLDVPKERFILYPDAGRSSDPTPLLGWAGWDHAQQALALATIVGAREEEGWPDERLVPLVAGLAELQPWVEQWHADIDPSFGVSLAAFCREQLADRCRQVGQTVDQLAAWRPAATTRGRRARV